MRRVPLLAVDATVVFDAIATAKEPPRRARMRRARPVVLAAYQDYENAVPEVGDLDTAVLTEIQKEALKHAFTVETLPMIELRGRLLKRVVVARCPFCGISETSTLDHYLPKEKYPEYSVFPLNLVPSCGVCNTRKRDRILEDGTDVRMFLHPCYDDIPDEAFVEVSTKMEGDVLVLSYKVVRPPGMSLRTYRHIRSHFTELNLADRYRLMGLEHLGGLYPSLRRAYGAIEDATRVAEKLVEGAEDFEEVFGPNYWLAKLYLALAVNDEFCDGGFKVLRVLKQPR